uniref:ARAD1C24508p n=1 Tax=Blastobotrys adeninivorans TaxID=409370 RepID=A0A060T1X3_BLAAD
MLRASFARTLRPGRFVGAKGLRKRKRRSESSVATTNSSLDGKANGGSSVKTPIGAQLGIQLKSSEGSSSSGTAPLHHLPPSTEQDPAKVQFGFGSMKPSATIEPEGEEKEPEDLQKYYHYFDTQRIYSGLKYAGFTEGQADVIMLTIRDLLSRKLADAREKASPISAAENEAYLFEAACSEIRSDIQIARQTQAADFRSSVSRLQRDAEILQQEMAELMSSLKSEMEMDINDRKNATRAEESALDLRIQELDNRITIDIISDLKSQVEELRWQTTRRGLIAVLLVASGILLATTWTRKDDKPRKVAPSAPPEEFQVPVLASSEVDDYPADERVEILGYPKT